MRGLYVAALLLVSLAVALPAPTLAGSAENPELTDPAGDQAIVRALPSVPSVSDDAFNDIDIRAAWFTTSPGPDSVEGATTNVTLTVRFGAPWQNSATLRIGLQAQPGPTSVYGSPNVARVFNETLQGITPSGNITFVSRTGNDLAISFLADPFGAFRVYGGDQLTIASLAASRTNPGSLPVTTDDQSGSDSATSTAQFTMPRPPVVASASLTVLGGTIRSTPPANFSGSEATVTSATTVVEFRIRLTNTGSDPDQFTFAHIFTSKDSPTEIPAIAEAALGLNPGESHERNVSLQFLANKKGTAVDGEIFATSVQVTSQAGANATLSLRLVLDLPSSPPPGAPREVVPARLHFLTPAAEGMGFDVVFDEYAEAAFLSLLVLLAILGIFFLLYLGPNLPYGEPATAAPDLGEAKPAGAKVRAAGKPKPAPVAPPPAPSAPTAPAAKEGDASLRLDAVNHDPPAPDAGDEVDTTVVLRGAERSMSVRVVLSVGGTEVAEEKTVVPSRAAKTVHLSWTAGPGDNKIRVQVFPL